MFTHTILTNAQIDLLKTHLAIRLTQLRQELARTDNRAYADSLRTDLTALEEVQLKLSGLQTIEKLSA